ncbi:MAG: ATP phosphoribosyltransferase regulatory subunit [Oscillospiraceae bacterium]|nr:ATP phosphoribosyltransferase regulatory subunit [Oscillospiraceae bacterium]
MHTTVGSAERVALSLRALYNQYGYSQYKMSKFEEYDLYARNKDFLISDGVITFTDLSGKLMALKPDVTLSIVKNSKDCAGVRKLYYNENVYRVTKGAHGYREIMQVGLEAIGDVDAYTICEVLLLAAKSLRAISDAAVLDISHLGLLSELMAFIGVPDDKEAQLVKFISEKNAHEMTDLCRGCGISEENISLLRSLFAMNGAPKCVLPELKALLSGKVSDAALAQFEAVICALEGSGVEDLLRIDFSVVDDMHYYNGFVFKGFINGLPGSLLSGGQYDNLMDKMKRSDRAIGFAVYTDLLERLEQPADPYDVDTVLLYDAGCSLSDIRRQAQSLTAQGISVLVQQTRPENIRFRQLLKLSGNEVKLLENNA